MRVTYVFAAVVTVLLVAVQSSVAAKSAPIVGRWQMVRTCQSMVAALKAAGLGPVAPGVVGGDYFPNQTTLQLAKKRNLCQGG